MKYEIIDLPIIAIIGKEGLCTKEKNVVHDLWHQANSNFSDIADLGMKNAAMKRCLICRGRTVSPGACIWQALKFMRIRKFRMDG